ncbi:MAG TPA: DUF924 family protein [Steroidobacteraceae bacterium]|jgi:uncharacterized protein (DUF924 family)
MSSPSSANDLLLFWFGPRPYTPERTQSHLRLWFGDANAPELTPQTDELIRERFGDLTDQASRGALSDWESSARRRLALIVVLDQFSRNIYRGSDRAFAQDLRALQLTVSGMQVGADATLDPVERLFFYMPLMHAESRAVQDESVAAFRRLLEESPTELRATFQASVDSAVEHRNVIERFGRFPSRNILLGRDSTPEEMDWLRGEGRNFAN